MLLAHALQTTLLAAPLLNLARPDLSFLVALAGAMLGGFEVGAVAGVGAGVLAGLAAAWHPGSFLVSRVIPPALLGSMSKRFTVSHPFAPPLCAFCATVLSDLLFMLMSPADFAVNWWAHHAFTTGIIHALLIWPVFWIVGRVVKPPERSLFA
jgi:hypothetical protein